VRKRKTAKDRDRRQGDDDVGAAAVAVEHHRERQQRVPGADLDQDEGDQQDHGGGEHRQGEAVGPAGRLRVREAVDEAEEAAGGEHRAGHVEVGLPLGAMVLQQHQRPDDGDRGEGEVDVEAPAPGEVLGEDAAEQQADRGAGARHRAEDAEGFAALGRIGEGDGEQREGGRGEDRAEEALDAAGDDQHAEGGRRATQGRGEGETDQPADEGPLAAEDVGDPAAEQEQGAEGQRVGGDDPLARAFGEAERFLGRGKGDVDDRRVEHHHQLGDPEDGQDQPAFVLGFGDAFHGGAASL
jgi:hypothetical protein